MNYFVIYSLKSMAFSLRFSISIKTVKSKLKLKIQDDKTTEESMIPSFVHGKNNK